MRELPLAAEHERLGAALGDVAGWRLPLDYGDPLAEQRTVRTAAGVIDWSANGTVRVTGPDRLPFLDGLLTNDLKTLESGHGLWAATLDHRGRVHGDMVVRNAGDHYILETEAEAGDRVLAYLMKLLVSDDVTLTDEGGAHGVFGLFGPRSGDIAANVLGIAPPTTLHAHVVADWEGEPAIVSRSPALGGEGYEVRVAAGSAAPAYRALIAAGARPFGHRAAEALRIEAGRPKFPVDMDETTLALEARLEPAISMTKGCYVGQEVVSRATYIGQVNRLLVGLHVDAVAPPPKGTVITAKGRSVGSVTSAAHSAWFGRTIALGYVRREVSEPGTELAVGEAPARVAALPFLR